MIAIDNSFGFGRTGLGTTKTPVPVIDIEIVERISDCIIEALDKAFNHRLGKSFLRCEMKKDAGPTDPRRLRNQIEGQAPVPALSNHGFRGIEDGVARVSSRAGVREADRLAIK